MFRRVIAGLILGPALLLGSFAWWGFLAQRTVFDESRTQTIAEELLDNDEVIDQLSVNVGRALATVLPDALDLSDEEIAATVDVILSDPVVRDVIVTSFGTTHRAFLGLDDVPATIDLGPALTSTSARLAVFRPDIAAAIPREFEVELPTDRIPDASPVKTFLERTVPIIAALAVTMALLALLTTSDRSAVLGRAARWAIGTTAFYLIVGLGVPFLLRAVAPDQAEILAAFLTAILRAALVPSIVLGGVGVVLLALSMFWPDPDRRSSREAARDARRSAPLAPSPATPVATPPRPQAARRSGPQSRGAPRGATPPSRSAAVPPAPEVPPPAPPRPAPDVTAPRPAPVAPAPHPAAEAPAPHPAAEAPAPPSRPGPPPRPPAAPRPTLPTRARPPEPVDLPAWTGEPSIPPETGGDPAVAAGPREGAPPPPRWVDGHGWVMDPDDPRKPPTNARHVEGVGWVIPGPPPDPPSGGSTIS